MEHVEEESDACRIVWRTFKKNYSPLTINSKISKNVIR